METIRDLANSLRSVPSTRKVIQWFVMENPDTPIVDVQNIHDYLQANIDAGLLTHKDLESTLGYSPLPFDHCLVCYKSRDGVSCLVELRSSSQESWQGNIFLVNQSLLMIAGKFSCASERGTQVEVQIIDKSMTEAISSIIATCQAANTFFHCKNVPLEDKPETRQMRRLAEREAQKSGTPIVKYKVLQIKQMVQAITETSRISGQGLAKAFHICRGHFRTYDETRKLFGKLTGTFWVPMHTRGKKENGEVRKSYKLER